MATFATRFDGWDADDAYEQIIRVLEEESPFSMPVELKDIRIDLEQQAVKIANKMMPLGQRAKTNLYSQVGLGKIDKIAKPETLKLFQADLDDYLKENATTIVFKVKRDKIEAVVCEDYKEIPHIDVVNIMQHLGGRPIRIYANDYIMRLQVIFEDRQISFGDESLMLGIQVHSSEMGAGALKLDVITFRPSTGGIAILSKKTVGAIRTVHVTSLKQAEIDMQREIEHVLATAQSALERMFGKLGNAKFDVDQVIDFLGRQRLGARALKLLAERIHTNKTMLDTWEVLTSSGSDSAFSQTVQEMLERSAGDLLHFAGA